MAETPLDQLTEDPAPLATDLVYVEHDPTGAPANRKAQIGNLAKLVGRVIDTQTASYVLALADANGVVRMNLAGANGLTIPPHSAVPLPVGTEIDVIQAGAGTTTLVAGAGVTVQSTAGLVLPGQHSRATLLQVAVDVWHVAISGAYEPLARTASGPLTTPPISSVVSILASGHGFTNDSSTLATLVDDTANYALGTQSLACTTKTDNTAGSCTKSGLTLDMTGKQLAVLVKVDDTSQLSELIVYAADTAFTNFYQWTIVGTGDAEAQKIVKPGEWCWITLNVGDASSTGTPPRSAINKIRLRQRCANGFSTTVRWNAIALVSEQSLYANGVVSICFDDGYANQYTIGKPVLDKYLFPATYFIIKDLIDSSGTYMTLAQLAALETAGSEIGGHAYTSVDHGAGLTTLTTDALTADLRSLRDWLLSNKFRASNLLAWPLGDFNPSTVAVAKQFFSAARSVISRTKHEHIRPPAPYRIRSISITDTNQAGVTAAIDAAYANKSWLILTFHSIVASLPGANEITTAHYTTIIDYLATKGIPVRTVNQVLTAGAAQAA